MDIFKKVTGRTREEVEQIYITAVNFMIEMGATPEQARKIAEETLRETLGL